MILRHSLTTLRLSWPPYAGAAVALAGGVGLIGLAVNLQVAGASAGAASDDLGSLFGVMAAISLFLALFVVASTFGFVVSTRRRELALLRLVGATPWQVRLMLLGEASAVAVVGTTAGVLVSTLATPLTLAALHHAGVTPVRLDSPGPGAAWAIAAPLGAGVAILGAWRAGARAGRTDPAEALREAVVERRRPGSLQILVGLVAAAGLVGAAVLAPRMPLLFALLTGFFLPACSVVGANAVGRLLYPELARLLSRPLARRDPAARLAGDLARSSGRMTSAVAAPVVAIAAVAGSMLLAVGATADWSEGADRAALAAPLVAERAERPARLAAVEGVAVADVRRTARVRIAGEVTDVEVVDVAAAVRARGLRAEHGSLARLHGRAVAVSASYVTDFGAHLGQTRTLRIAGHATRARIVAILPDAPDLWGDVVVPGDLPGIGRVARPTGTVLVVNAPGTGTDELAAALRARGATVRTAAAWVSATSRTARDTNTMVLWVLLGPAGIYAAIGAVNAVLIGSGQRRRQLDTARLLGATPGQVRRTTVWETAFTGAAAVLVGGAITAFTGWLVRQAVVRDVPDAPLTVPWLPLAGITAACLVVLLAAAVTSARSAGAGQRA